MKNVLLSCLVASIGVSRALAAPVPPVEINSVNSFYEPNFTAHSNSTSSFGTLTLSSAGNQLTNTFSILGGDTATAHAHASWIASSSPDWYFFNDVAQDRYYFEVTGPANSFGQIHFTAFQSASHLDGTFSFDETYLSLDKWSTSTGSIGNLYSNVFPTSDVSVDTTYTVEINQLYAVSMAAHVMDSISTGDLQNGGSRDALVTARINLSSIPGQSIVFSDGILPFDGKTDPSSSDPSSSAVPEPSTYGLLGAVALLLGASVRRLARKGR